MTSSIVHVDLELNESAEVGDQAALVVVDPKVDGKPMEEGVAPGVDPDVEMLEIGKQKEADALSDVSPDVEMLERTVAGDDQSEENLDEEVLEVEEPKQDMAPLQVNLVEEVLEVDGPSEDVEVLEIEKGGQALSVEYLDVEMLEVVKPKEDDGNPEVNLEDEVLEVEKLKESEVLVNQDGEMVKARKSEEKIASSQVNSDVELLEIENPKELDAAHSEISLHVEGLKLDDDVKKTLASKDDENKDALKDKEELKEDDDVCEEVKEIEVGEVVLDQPEEREEAAKKVDEEENVSKKDAEVVELEEEEEDDLQIVHESTSTTSTKVHSTSGRVLRSGTVAASAVVSLEKCTTCRQRLAELHKFHPERGVGLEQLSKDQAVNIDLGEELESLQYKLTDFAVYDKVNEGERHLVPIFAESLLSAKKELWVSGKVLRIDQEDEEDGLRVADLGPITQWTNVTGIEGGENNVILSMEYKGVDVEFNLVRPHKKYMPLYKNIFRMVFMANRIIMRLIECADRGGSMEYSELLEFLDSLTAPQLFEEKLPRLDEEFLQLHSDFIVSQVRYHCYYYRHPMSSPL